MKNYFDIRNEFPILKDYIFLDTASSAQKPLRVLRRVFDFCTKFYANTSRGSYKLSDYSTDFFESSRDKVCRLINANKRSEIVFTKNSTESINIIAKSIVKTDILKKDSEILLTKMEHHANILPWIEIAKENNLKIRYLDFDHNKELKIDFNNFINEKTSIISLNYVSNVFGTHNDIKKICKIAKSQGIITVIDACQALPHKKVDVKNINCDFMVFSSHKMYGPSGVGILYGKKDLLDILPPFLSGGDMIKELNEFDFITKPTPHKFEAGTQSIEAVVGFGEAIDFINDIGYDTILNNEIILSNYCRDLLSEIHEVEIISHKDSTSLVTFDVKGINNYDISDYLSEHNICVRVGGHCAYLLHKTIDLKTTIRVSFGVYTTKKDIDQFIFRLKKAIRLFT